MLAELERAHLEYHRSEHRPMLYAASPGVQRAYALVEGTYQDVGALPGHPATFRISKVHHILSMEVGVCGSADTRGTYVCGCVRGAKVRTLDNNTAAAAAETRDKVSAGWWRDAACPMHTHCLLHA